MISCTHLYFSEVDLHLQQQSAISAFCLNATLSCQRLLYLWTGMNQYPAYHVSEQVHKLCSSDLALWFSSLLFFSKHSIIYVDECPENR